MMAEMATGRMIFPADSEIDSLLRIFRTLGTPNEIEWPGCTSWPFWNEAYAKYLRSQGCPEAWFQGTDSERRRDALVWLVGSALRRQYSGRGE